MDQTTKGLIGVADSLPVMELYLCEKKMPVEIREVVLQGEKTWMLDFDCEDLAKFLQKNFCELAKGEDSLEILTNADYSAPSKEEVGRYFVRLLTEHIILHCRRCGGTNLHQVWDSRRFYPWFICQNCGERTPPPLRKYTAKFE